MIDAAWQAAHQRYEDLAAPAALFNLSLLTALRGRWGASVRPDTSMFTLLFTRPDETGYSFTERVQVTYQGSERVEMALVRDRSRRSPSQRGGRAVVTGDITRPENALAAVEALLYQLAEPEEAPHHRD